MTRIPRAVADEIDALVLELDTATIDEPSTMPPTSSWIAIAAAWRHFKARVDALDKAVSTPLAQRSPRVLQQATALVNEDAYRLSFWLAHVGVALARRSHPLRSR